MRINYLRDIEDDAEDIDIPAVCNLYKLDWFLQGVTRGRTKDSQCILIKEMKKENEANIKRKSREIQKLEKNYIDATGKL